MQPSATTNHILHSQGSVYTYTVEPLRNLGHYIHTLRLLLIAGTNFNDFSGNQQNR